MSSALSAICNTPHKNHKTPAKTPKPANAKTPAADRFIPTRRAMDFDSAHFSLTSNMENESGSGNCVSPNTADYQKSLQSALSTCPEAKVLAFKTKAPAPPEGYMNNLRVLYSQNRTAAAPRKAMRTIPSTADRILDAPDLRDDYYVNLIDWHTSQNLLAVALGPAVYVWNAETSGITKLCELPGEDSYVSSVSWMADGEVLAVGTDDATVQIWDANNLKRLRTMRGHQARVGSLSWNGPMLSSGSRSGNIHHHDVRMQEHLIGTLSGHTQEVCGLKWSLDGTTLASGGNDNLLNIWDARQVEQPRFTLSDHQAAVKALAWCPWQDNLLASGGGTADRTIRFWNTQTGACLNSIDTKSQVCSLLWSKTHKEIVSSHGFSQNQLCVWKYPSMAKVAELTGHTSRVLHMAMSPDGQTVVSAAADETLRFWKCFATDSARRTAKAKPGATASHPPAGRLSAHSMIR